MATDVSGRQTRDSTIARRFPVDLLWMSTIATALLALTACRDVPPAPSPVPDAGAAIVRGTERLAWSQAGYVPGLRFRAYVDHVRVSLDAVTCGTATPEAACTAPLPPMTDGVHTIALASVLEGDLESERSEPLVVQKVSAGPTSLASLYGARARSGAPGLQTTLQIGGNFAFTSDVAARDIRTPAQMAWIPDGRLLVAEADGGIRVVRSERPDRVVHALDAGQAPRMLGSVPAGTPGLAIHPEFAENRFVYVAFLVEDTASFHRLRVVRLREVGDTLGDPAPLFETTVASRESDGRSREGPRIAFGPDGLLYVALPYGFTFEREPTASAPHASMLRLRDDGRPPDVAPLSGVRAHPLAFTWDPSTDLLWLVFSEGSEAAAIEPVLRPSTPLARTIERSRLPATLHATPSSRTLIVRDATDIQAHGVTRALLGTRGTARAVRVMLPIAADGLADRFGDFVSGADGTWFVVTSDGADAGAVIVRLTPVAPRIEPQRRLP